MGYCTVATIRKVPAFRTFAGDGGFRNEEIESYIDRATNIINSYLREKVPGIPFAEGSVPPEITDVCARLTICIAVQEMKTLHGSDDSAMGGIEFYCSEAWSYLKDLARGLATIEVTDEDDSDYSRQSIFYAGDTSFLTDEL